MRKIKVFLVCSGLGNIQRGYESFTRECFTALQSVDSLDIRLFKGGGKPAKREIPLWNLPRQHPLTERIGQVLAKLTGKGANPYFTEQLSFCTALLPYLYLEKPDVIYFSDESIGDFLWHWRRVTGMNYRLLFCNGGPTSNLPNIVRWDHVHQVAPVHFQAALEIGLPPERQSLVLPGIEMPSRVPMLSSEERETLRRTLNLPESRPIVLSVAAIDRSRKRIDYLIRELATLPEPRPYFVCLGQPTGETPELLTLGNRLLGAENLQFRTVSQGEVKEYYRVSDAFVLASLIEGLSRAFVEALSYGLPCLAHDYEVSSFVLGKEGYLDDFTRSNGLAGLIPRALAESRDLSKRIARHRRAYTHFSWEMLTPQYVELIYRCQESAPSDRKSTREPLAV